MLGEFKSDQFFAEKTKLANNLCVEILIISHDISLQQSMCSK